MIDWTNYYLASIGEGIGTFVGSLIATAIITAVICLIATPFIKRLIKYAIDEYKKNKKE